MSKGHRVRPIQGSCISHTEERLVLASRQGLSMAAQREGREAWGPRNAETWSHLGNHQSQEWTREQGLRTPPGHRNPPGLRPLQGTGPPTGHGTGLGRAGKRWHVGIHCRHGRDGRVFGAEIQRSDQKTQRTGEGDKAFCPLAVTEGFCGSAEGMRARVVCTFQGCGSVPSRTAASWGPGSPDCRVGRPTKFDPCPQVTV